MEAEQPVVALATKKKRKKKRLKAGVEGQAATAAKVVVAEEPTSLRQLFSGCGADVVAVSKTKRPSEDNAEAEDSKTTRKKKTRSLEQEQSSPSARAQSLLPPSRPLPAHKLVLAPMVGGSELAFRLLSRRHGAELAYTPMMYSDRFVADPLYRAAELQTLAADAPLVAHFCANNAATLLAAARLAEPHCVAVDINLGCPQRAAHSGCFGSFCRQEGDTSDKMDLPFVLNMVSTVARGLRVPLFVKIRLQDELEDTLAFCRQLEAAGCALLAVHGRYRGSPTHKREGPAHLAQVAAVKQALSIPVLTNGNVNNASDLLASLKETGADGVMSAEGALDDPAIFGRAVALAQERRLKLKGTVREAKRLRAEEGRRALSASEQKKVDGLLAAREELRGLPVFATASEPTEASASTPCDLAEQYLALAKMHRPTLRCVVFHVRRICRVGLIQFGLREPLEKLSSSGSDDVRVHPVSSGSLKSVAAIIHKLREYTEGRATPPASAVTPSAAQCASNSAAAAETAAASVAAAAARARQAAATGPEDENMKWAVAACAQKRGDFEQMQRRKAKRKGLPEDHFLNVGRATPTVADVARVKAMGDNERMAYWREHYGQHCIMHHMDGRCEVALSWGCGFLHETAV